MYKSGNYESFKTSSALKISLKNTISHLFNKLLSIAVYIAICSLSRFMLHWVHALETSQGQKSQTNR